MMASRFLICSSKAEVVSSSAFRLAPEKSMTSVTKNIPAWLLRGGKSKNAVIVSPYVLFSESIWRGHCSSTPDAYSFFVEENNYPQLQNKSGSRVRFYQGGMETLIALATDSGNRPPRLLLQKRLFYTWQARHIYILARLFGGRENKLA
jgi:hypothetical protein